MKNEYENIINDTFEKYLVIEIQFKWVIVNYLNYLSNC